MCEIHIGQIGHSVLILSINSSQYPHASISKHYAMIKPLIHIKKGLYIVANL